MHWFKPLSTGVLIFIMGLAAATAATAMSHGKKSDIQAHMAWVRAVPPVATNTAAYMMLHNYSQQDDRIIGVESPVAAAAELHSSDMSGGTMKMKKLDNLTVPAKGYVMFEPASHHIMLINLKQPLKVGDTVPVTLVFEHHGRIDMQLSVSEPPEAHNSQEMENSHNNHNMNH